MTVETVSQDNLTERLQLSVTPEAAARIRMVAGVLGQSHGEVVSSLAETHLPQVPKTLTDNRVRQRRAS